MSTTYDEALERYEPVFGLETQSKAVAEWSRVNGTLSQLELDTKGRGTPDRRLIYRPDGAFDHIETDPTGSGTFTRLKQ